MDDRARFLERAPALGLPDWWLTAGALFQTVWNGLDGRDPAAGIRDDDLFYDDDDVSYAAEDRVIQAAARLFADLDAVVEVRNEARVHLWYEERFGVPAEAFTSATDAVDHFASTTCCFAVTTLAGGGLEVYAPHGYGDLFARRVRPIPVMAPRAVYEAKERRWQAEWPSLRVDPWPDPA
ncbi:nucleotidyltransferase family protein [Quadrisphaera oryzae]|uniref:nucleotidyltransferase family protein n=1 Tax=Quadrisphaera TaxID=317661 RepID=UPI001C973A24